jgi:hypothetical protein
MGHLLNPVFRSIAPQNNSPKKAIFAQRIEKVKLADFTIPGCRCPLRSWSGARNLHFGVLCITPRKGSIQNQG